MRNLELKIAAVIDGMNKSPWEKVATGKRKPNIYDSEVMGRISDGAWGLGRVVLFRFGMPHSHPTILAAPTGGTMVDISPGWHSGVKLVPATYLETPTVWVDINGHKGLLCIKERIEQGPDDTVDQLEISVDWQHSKEDLTGALFIIEPPSEAKEKPARVDDWGRFRQSSVLVCQDAYETVQAIHKALIEKTKE